MVWYRCISGKLDGADAGRREVSRNTQKVFVGVSWLLSPDHDQALGICGCVFREQQITSHRQGGGLYWGEVREAQKGLSTFFFPPEIDGDKLHGWWSIRGKWRKKYGETKLAVLLSFQKWSIALICYIQLNQQLFKFQFLQTQVCPTWVSAK